MQTIDRRELMKKAGITAGAAGALWMTPAVDRFISPAAAMSGTASSDLYKATRGNDPNAATSDFCVSGAATNVSRGTVDFTRSENPATMSVTISLGTGTGIAGRGVYLLQSDGTTCRGGTGTALGTWAASPAAGPQTFSGSILAGATTFVVLLWQSGGNGNAQYATAPVSLP